MQDLNIGLLQFDQLWEDKAANYNKIRSFMKGSSDIDLLLLPEMFHTGFTMNHEPIAEKMEMMFMQTLEKGDDIVMDFKYFCTKYPYNEKCKPKN